ncbi:basic proline-rich protein-like [Rattus rattus]|uniref:basic proline-rich protein-like n=1 Tax=Rattus rattus TaxID=10117 RepID=UPI0013F32473|nr:basic proline-rich protein-like [Rattus rattus]
MCTQKVRPKLLIIPAAGKDSLFFSHRLCQTQAPFAKTEQISHSPRPQRNPADSRTLKTVAIRSCSGSPLTPPYSPPHGALLRARAQPPFHAPGGRGAPARGRAHAPSPFSRAPAPPAFPPYPTQPRGLPTRAAHSPGRRAGPGPSPSPFPSCPHPRVQRAGASLELRPRPPPRAAAGASPALRGSRARHSHKMSALTELLPAATLRPSPSPPAYSPPRIRPPTPPSRAQGELRVEGERFASLVQAEWTRHPLAVSLSEQHLLTKPIGGRTGRAGDGGGSWAEGEGRRVAETLRLREASRTGRRP